MKSIAKVLCIGDIILDCYSNGSVDRVSPEAPIPVLKILKENIKVLGGAGNVARNICAADTKCHLISIIGDDLDSRTVVSLCKKEKNLTFDLIIDKERCTTKKHRFVSGNQQILRVDSEDTNYISEKIERKILEKFKKNIKKFKVIVISDYQKGLLTKKLIANVIKISNHYGKVIIVDPKNSDLGFYKYSTIITPNKKELLGNNQHNINDQIIEKVSKKLIKDHGFESVITTRGSEGISVIKKNGKNFHIPSKAKEVFDVSGAGDTVVSYIASGIARNDDFFESIELANKAAGIAVGKFGTAIVRRSEIRDKENLDHKVLSITDLMIELDSLKPRKIGFTNGCFDLIHQGHIDYLKKAREQCDFLIVGLNSDGSVEKLKGPARPIINQYERSYILSSFEFIDRIIMFNEQTPINLIKKIKPNFIFKGDDYKVKEVVGNNEIKKWNGKIILIKCTKNKSSSKIIERIKNGT